MKNEKPVTTYEIVIGMNDKSSREEKFTEENYERIIFNVCKGLNVSYSISKLSGVYIHEDGTPVREKSICLIILGINDEQAEEIARDFCLFFNQESVLVHKMLGTYTFISENIKNF